MLGGDRAVVKGTGMDRRDNARPGNQIQGSFDPATVAGDACTGERLKRLELENRLLREVIEGLVGEIVLLARRERTLKMGKSNDDS
jgi:hypothetical protein